MALTQFLPMDSYYHGILAATEVLPAIYHEITLIRATYVLFRLVQGVPLQRQQERAAPVG